MTNLRSFASPVLAGPENLAVIAFAVSDKSEWPFGEELIPLIGIASSTNTAIS